MRVLLVGQPDDRDRLRPQLAAAGVQVVAEAEHEPAQPPQAIDAVVLARRRQHDRPADRDTARHQPLESLTARELEVLAVLAEGLPNKAIASHLGISDQTVKFHVAAIIGKLGAANRTDAVRRAVRRGLVAL